MSTIQASPAAVEVSTIDWPTKIEVSQRLGVSVKTVEKYIAQGKLVQKLQPQINRPARSVIDPASLERLLSEREVVRGSSSLPTTSAPVPQAVVDAVSRWSSPLWLTEEQAVAYSGLGLHYLRGAVEWRKIGPRGAKVTRKTDLDSL